MKRSSVTSFFSAFFLLIFMVSGASAQEFLPGTPIPVPEPDINTGGVGDILTDVDFDFDGRMDLYWINQQWADDPNGQEQTPRMYKFEYNGSEWEIVWQCTLTVVTKQNSFPAMQAADLDQDKLMEIIWCPPNWYDSPGVPSANPYRMIVFEQSANGGDTLGIPDGFGNYMPNSMWTISDQDNDNVRPHRIEVADIDDDDTLEVIFCDRNPSGSGQDWFFGVCSVDTIPNNAGQSGSDTWVLEYSGVEAGLAYGLIENKWDMAVMADEAYFFDELQCTTIRATAPNTYELRPPQSSVLPNAGSWTSAVTADIDNNGTEEIIVGSYWNTLGPGETHGIYLYTREYPLPKPTPETPKLDSLYGEKIFDLGPYFSGYGVAGGKLGDVDQDGDPDYIFGSRNADPNGAIFRLEYTGPADSVFNETYWEFSVIDSHFADYASNTGRWSHIDIVDFDADPLQEVLNTSLNPAGGTLGTSDASQPVYVLENQTQLVYGPWNQVDVPYVFVEKMHTELGSGHGITVDRYGNIWYGEYDGDDALKVFAPDGTPLDTIKTVVVPIPGAGRDTTFTLSDCRGLNTDIDGNILYCRSGYVLKIDVDTHQALTYCPFSGSPLNPAVDDQGFIYVGYVVGVTPIQVIDPASFTITQSITLEPPHAGWFARGMDVSLDGLTFYPGDLEAAPHVAPIYTSTDYQNYAWTDTINTNNAGAVIFQNQAVTVHTKPTEGTIWYTIDNAYGTGGLDQLVNSLVMFDFDTDEYGYLYMPPPVGPTGKTGPRGVAWSPTGDTLYVASWGEGAIYKYVSESVLSIDEEGQGGLPVSYELNQNYPNPFNPITNIEFTVPQAGKVKLTVFNILGQKVVTLVDQNVPRGTFKVQFDGSKYASGMYIYRLEANKVRIDKKMMLIK